MLTLENVFGLKSNNHSENMTITECKANAYTFMSKYSNKKIYLHYHENEFDENVCVYIVLKHVLSYLLNGNMSKGWK